MLVKAVLLEETSMPPQLPDTRLNLGRTIWSLALGQDDRTFVWAISLTEWRRNQKEEQEIER